MQTEHVLVTGGTGRLGRFVVAALRPHYRVTTLDLAQTHIAPDLPIDILDLPGLQRALRGVHAIVHLAAIDASVPAPPAAVFETNVRGTWNVIEAAQLNGVQRIVLCSSVSAFGIDHTNPTLPPLYLPIDEDHPLRPTQPYGLSKQLGEDIARSFARRGPMVFTCLRPAWIMFPDILARLVDWSPVPGRSRSPPGADPAVAFVCRTSGRRVRGPAGARAVRPRLRHLPHYRRRHVRDTADARSSPRRVRRPSRDPETGDLPSESTRELVRH